MDATPVEIGGVFRNVGAAAASTMAFLLNPADLNDMVHINFGTTTVNASVQVVGVGTLFLTELSVGDAITLSSAATTYIVVVDIADNTHLTLVQAIGNNTAGTTISKRPRAVRLDTNDGVMMLSEGGGPSNVGQMQLHGTSLTQNKWAGSATITQRRLDGTRALPTAVQSAETLASLVQAGFDGANFGNAATVSSAAGSTWTTSNHESFMSLSTVPNGSTTITERLRVRSDGLLSTSAAYASGKTLQADGSNVLQPVNFPYCIPIGQCTVALPNGRGAAPAAGTIVKFMVTVIVASTGAATCKLQIAGVDVTGSSVSIANTDAAGTVFTGTCTAANVVAAGNALTAVLSADASAVVSAYAYVG